MKRRAFLQGLLSAPVVITTPGLLMPVKAFPVDGRASFLRSRAPRNPVSFSVGGGETWSWATVDKDGWLCFNPNSNKERP